MTRLERNIMYALPIISICFEILKSFIGGETPIMSLRNYSFCLFILYLTVKYFKQVILFNPYLIVIIIYFLVLLIYDNSGVSEYSDLVQFIDAKMLLPLSFVLTTSYANIKDLHRNFLIVNVLFVVSILIFSVFEIGINQYGSSSGFRTGAFEYSAIYIGSFLLVLYPLFLQDLKKKVAKNVLILLGVLTVIVLVLSVRRSALVILIIGSMVYVYLYRAHFARIALYGLGFLFLLILAYPLYEDTLNKQIAARGDVFNEKGTVQNLQEETRLAETIAVYEERLKTPDVNVFLFGDYLFESAGHYAGGIHGKRPLHLDVNIILHGSGMIGLIIFLLIYIRIFLRYQSLKTPLDPHYNRNMTGAFVGMFISHAFLLISGGMITMTFNQISSLYMGAILGLYARSRAHTLAPFINEMATENLSSGRKSRLKAKPYIYEGSNNVDA